ncbi:MAG: hypothetical protein JJV99_13285 [Colwellia sp.]|nr:hypothetical protein [Colwellia sp.]
MNEQIALTAFNNPYETVCFTLGGILVTIGLFMATVMQAGEWKNKGIHLLGSGSLIAFPGVFPMMIFLVGGNNNDISIPLWLLNGVSILGVIFGVYSWVSESKKFESKQESAEL